MFCKYCGKESASKYHHECWPYRTDRILYHPDRFCTICGVMLSKRKNGTNTNGELCVDCMPVKMDPFKMRGRATNLVHQYPERVVVIGECDCRGVKKIKHHHDYFNPFSVMMLCRPCHGKEHARIRKSATRVAEQ